jgi:hypothetical protein
MGVSAAHVVVSVSIRHDGPVAAVRLTGDIDLAAETALAGAAEEIRVLALRRRDRSCRKLGQRMESLDIVSGRRTRAATP